MPRIGEFKETKYGFEGQIQTREGRFGVQLHRDKDKEHDASPDFRALAPNGAEIGAGFTRTAQDSGNEYHYLTIDDPAQPQPIKGNLVNDGDGRWGFMYSRDRAQSRDAVPERNAGQGTPEAGNSAGMHDPTEPAHDLDQGRDR